MFGRVERLTASAPQKPHRKTRGGKRSALLGPHRHPVLPRAAIPWANTCQNVSATCQVARARIPAGTASRLPAATPGPVRLKIAAREVHGPRHWSRETLASLRGDHNGWLSHEEFEEVLSEHVGGASIGTCGSVVPACSHHDGVAVDCHRVAEVVTRRGIIREQMILLAPSTAGAGEHIG